jgi:hypothetical protein
VNTEVVSLVLDWLRDTVARTPVRDAPLHHYTTSAGLRGILTERVIRASHALSLNDTAEIVHIESVIDDVRGKLLREFSDGEAAKFLGHPASDVVGIVSGLYNAYVACFCEVPDLLSQWRGYAPGEVGYSVAVTGDWARYHANPWSVLFAEINHPDKPTPVVLRRVTYDRQEQEEVIEALYRPLCALMASGGTSAQEVLVRVRVALFEVAVSFKHEGFCEEREWRLIYVDEGLPEQIIGPKLPITTFDRRGTFVPYVPIGFEREGLSVAGITVGPVRHPEVVERGARRFLDEVHPWPHVAICRSAIPLRS